VTGINNINKKLGVVKSCLAEAGKCTLLGYFAPDFFARTVCMCKTYMGNAAMWKNRTFGTNLRVRSESWSIQGQLINFGRATSIRPKNRNQKFRCRSYQYERTI